MILGVGVDVVDLDGFGPLLSPADALGAGGDSRFVLSTFTADERRYAESGTAGRTHHLAARFAAKEAALKALDGAGRMLGLRLPRVPLVDVEVVRDPEGRPGLRWHGAAHEVVSALEVHAAHLSIAHDGKVATAFVVLER